jgi:hypothetical protein
MSATEEIIIDETACFSVDGEGMNCEKDCEYIQPVLADLRRQLADMRRANEQMNEALTPGLAELGYWHIARNLDESRGQLADAEQAIKIACEQQDASERDTFTAITAREEAEMERDELREIYKHTHKGPGDPCGKCGLDIRDEIHVRLAAEQEEGKR